MEMKLSIEQDYYYGYIPRPQKEWDVKPGPYRRHTEVDPSFYARYQACEAEQERLQEELKQLYDKAPSYP